MKTKRNIELRSMRCLITLTLTLTVIGSAQLALGEFPEFTTTAGVPEGVIVDSVGNIYISISDTNDQVWKLLHAGEAPDDQVEFIPDLPFMMGLHHP